MIDGGLRSTERSGVTGSIVRQCVVRVRPVNKCSSPIVHPMGKSANMVLRVHYRIKRLNSRAISLEIKEQRLAHTAALIQSVAYHMDLSQTGGRIQALHVPYLQALVKSLQVTWCYLVQGSCPESRG